VIYYAEACDGPKRPFAVSQILAMMPRVMQLPAKWATALRSAPETGMGYTVCRVELSDGREFERVLIVDGTITRCDGRTTIPFAADEIAGITPTHDKSALG